ncbi:HIT family protein [Streptococcus saliviloxodontae]|uniref:Histidine triad (HIT) family protein n=1 Tax=Streptococcus saliviloxodontae TaxID=1349416 RepID=A0ABS2PJ54_9STRE|nr:HIT family protein [Streptococcus saliviloxodontae]MBM7635465.1 histidine triad (HIT) family protein [Streptococcus saliviloxodontae]
MSCIFCDLSHEDNLYESDYFYAIWDIDPIQEGHLLLISKAHRMAFQELSIEERYDLLCCQEKLLDHLEKEPLKGVTMAINNGNLMDEGTHFHQHFIPRYEGDGFWEAISLEKRAFDQSLFKKGIK